MLSRVSSLIIVYTGLVNRMFVMQFDAKINSYKPFIHEFVLYVKISLKFMNDKHSESGGN